MEGSGNLFGKKIFIFAVFIYCSGTDKHVVKLRFDSCFVCYLGSSLCWLAISSNYRLKYGLYLPQWGLCPIRIYRLSILLVVCMERNINPQHKINLLWICSVFPRKAHCPLWFMTARCLKEPGRRHGAKPRTNHPHTSSLLSVMKMCE